MKQPWDSHKETIRELYLIQDMTISEVMERMELDHGFKADTGQYERQFKKWGFRKNLKREQWQWVLRRVEKRKREGKETDLKIDGVLVPRKKIQKASKTYGWVSTLERMQKALQRGTSDVRHSPTPEGLAVCTPASFAPPTFDFDSLPFIQFRNLFQPETPNYRDSFSGPHPPGNFDGSQSLILRSSGQTWRGVVHAALPLLGRGEEGSMISKHFPDLDSSDSDLFSIAVLLSINHFHSGLSSKASRMSYLRWNLEEISQLPQKLLRFFKSSRAVPALQRLLHDNSPAVEALSEVLFKEALLSRDLEVVRILAQHEKVDLDTLLPGPWPIQYTSFSEPQLPLEVAIRLQDLSLVKELVRRGAKVDVSPSTVVGAPDGILEAIDMNSSIDSKFFLSVRKNRYSSVEQLLIKGVSANAKDPSSGIPALVSAAYHRKTSLAKLLLRYGADANISIMGIGPLHVAAASGHMSVSSVLIEGGAKVEPSTHIRSSTAHDNTFRPPTPLQLAVYHQNFAMVQLLLDHGADPNAAGAKLPPSETLPDEFSQLLDLEMSALDGCTALDIAHTLSVPQSSEMVCFLLSYAVWTEKAGPKPLRYHNPNGTTLVHAIGAGYLDIVDLLLDAGLLYTSEALCTAAAVGDMEMVRRCVDAGVDINELNKDEHSVLTSAILPERECHSGTPLLDVCKFLIKLGADINHSKARPTALEAALKRPGSYNESATDLPRFLIEHGARCDTAYSFYLATNSVLHLESSILELLFHTASTNPSFDARFRRSCFGHPALYNSMRRNGWKEVKMLLKRGINVHARCAVEAVRIACIPRVEPSNESMLRLLLSYGIPVNPPEDPTSCRCWSPHLRRNKSSPLHTAFEWKLIDVAKILLEYGADPNFYAHKHVEPGQGHIHGNTETSLLTMVVSAGYTDAVELLLENGADVNLPAKGDFGRTALQAAVENQNRQMPLIERLVEAGAGVNAPPAKSKGVTALQAAAIGGFISIAYRLLELGAQVDAPGAEEDGRMALEGAAEHGRIDMVRLLLDAGADLTAPQYGNAVELARKNGYNAVANMLMRYKAGER